MGARPGDRPPGVPPRTSIVEGYPVPSLPRLTGRTTGGSHSTYRGAPAAAIAVSASAHPPPQALRSVKQRWRRVPDDVDLDPPADEKGATPVPRLDVPATRASGTRLVAPQHPQLINTSLNSTPEKAPGHCQNSPIFTAHQ